jgi:hypothetical protein
MLMNNIHVKKMHLEKKEIRDHQSMVSNDMIYVKLKQGVQECNERMSKRLQTNVSPYAWQIR